MIPELTDRARFIAAFEALIESVKDIDWRQRLRQAVAACSGRGGIFLGAPMGCLSAY